MTKFARNIHEYTYISHLSISHNPRSFKSTFRSRIIIHISSISIYTRSISPSLLPFFVLIEFELMPGCELFQKYLSADFGLGKISYTRTLDKEFNKDAVPTKKLLPRTKIHQEFSNKRTAEGGGGDNKLCFMSFAK